MSGTEFRIDLAADYPHYLEIIAPWHHRQWRHLNPPGDTVDRRLRRYRQECNAKRIPLMVVAHDGERVMGSARLVECDMETHPELSPWLASLYVHPDFRGRGIATALIQRIEQHAHALGHARLYLYTEDGEAFYAPRGWRTLGRETYRGEEVVIMQRALDTPEA